MPHPVPSRCTPRLLALPTLPLPPALRAPLCSRGAWLALALGALFLAPAGARAQCIMAPGQQQATACTDAEAPYGSLSPSTGAFNQAAVPVTVSWMDESPTYVAWIKWNGAVVTSAFEVRTWHAAVPDADIGEHGQATGTVVITAGQPNTIEARVCDKPVGQNPGGRCSTWTATYSLAPQPGVEVTPKSGFASVTASASAGTQAFTVRNTGGSAATFTLAATCRDAAAGQALSTCSLSSSSVQVAAGGTQTVTLSYSRPTAGRVLLLQVRAAQAGAQGVQDAGWVDVEVYGAGGGQQAPAVSVVDLNSGTEIERSQCVTVSAGAGAAYECGDLRLAHALPATTTYGKVRAPALIYNSQHAHPRPIVYADVTLPAGTAAPTTVRADLTLWNGTVVSRSFSGGEWRPGTTRRIAVQFDAQQVPTGIYSYSLRVTNVYTTTQYPANAQNGQIIIVNRGNSPYGPGWWVAGLEQIIYQPNNGSFVWIGGDGSTRWYTWVGPGLYAPAGVDRRDTIIAPGPGDEHYVRRLGGGAEVRYNTSGQHVQTRNRLQHVTRFYYHTTWTYLVDRVVMPTPPGADSVYHKFIYDQYTSRLVHVTSPGQRYTTVYQGAAGLDSIRDPDNTVVRFGYDAGAPYRVNRRTDRRGVPTTFAYDGAGKLASASLTLEDGQAIIQGFEALEGKGLSTSVALAQAYTRLDGPRTDVADHTLLWLNRWGAPTRVRDALGGETVIARTNPTFPALPTEVTSPGGLVTRAWYNARALVDSVMVVDPLGTGQNAVTRYTWHPRWNSPTSVSAPGAAPVTAEYDAYNGNVLWQQQGDASRRAYFDYHDASSPLAGLLARVRYPHPVTGAPGGGGSDSLAYDAMGNLRMTRTPLGFLTLHSRDALGRDTLTVTPIDTAHARDEGLLSQHGARQRTEYDAMNRPWRTTALGPAITHAAGAEGWVPKPSPAEQLVVTTTYNENGQPLGILRESSPYENEQYTEYEYDHAGRTIVERTGSVTQRFAYDPAGNVVTATTGRGHQITTQYDALGRPTRRTVPSATEAAQLISLPGMYGSRQFPLRPNSGSGYTVYGETSFFRYDQAGGMVYAENRDAIVTRSYYRGGALRTDSLRLRGYWEASFDQHVYGLEYRYNQHGQLVGLVHPTNLATAAGAQRDTFDYEAVTGALSYARDRVGNPFTFQYDLLGRPVTTRMPGVSTDLVERAEFDAAGRMVRHTTGSDALPSDLMDERMIYDARGKIVRAEFPNGTASTQRQWYSGLGYLAATEWDNDGGPGYERESYVLDGLGNIRQKRTAPAVSDYPHDYHMLYRIDPVNGRVLEIVRTDTLAMQEPFVQDSATRQYDASGNMVLGTQYREEGSGVRYSITRSYFGADDRLRATQVVDESAGGNAGVWEEYRYDPLGRRVLVRSVRHGNAAPPGAPYSMPLCGTSSCRSAITRYVWAGDQMVWELRAPGADGDDLEATTGASEPRFYGRVSYLHARGIDRPLSIWKEGVGSVRPHQNWRGQFARGTWGAGPLQGRSTDCAYAGAPDCIPLHWPGYRTNAWHQQSRAGDPEYWMGSLVDGMRDVTGQIYMRNRYYDPATGQFTQPDPIGIAGGLNSYGFAAGDPVSYSDPYGLRTDSITFQVVWTGPGAYHTSIRITPEKGSRWASDPRFSRGSLTLGAGPGTGTGPIAAARVWGGTERMKSEYNRPGDIGTQTATFLLDPGAQGEDAAIGRLLAADAKYGDDLRYEFYPDQGFMGRLLGSGYNSNSYTAGLLNAAGISAPGCSGSQCYGYYVPGFEKPVPASEFR